MAFGAALVAVSEETEFSTGRVDDGAVAKSAEKGARRGFEIGLKSAASAMDTFRTAFG